MAPRFAWERLKRSTPQNQLETTDCLGFLEKQPTRIPFDKTNRAGRALTACGLTGLALLAGNVIKTLNLFLPPNIDPANSGQVRVETVVMGHFMGHFTTF